MPRREVSPGFGKRIERIRARLPEKLSASAFARYFGVAPPTYRNWVDEDASTGAITLKRGLVALGVWDLEKALSWLADGEGAAPAWLEDLNLDPRVPPSPGSSPPEGSPSRPPAMPQGILEHLEGARGRLANLVVESGGRVQGAVLRALAELEDGLRMLPPATTTPAVPLLPRLDSNQEFALKSRLRRGA